MMDAFERRRNVMMRFCGPISTETYGEGFDSCNRLLADGYTITVLLNGVGQPFCAWADPDKGELGRYRTMNGAIVYHYGAAQTEVVKGDVVVKIERETVA